MYTVFKTNTLLDIRAITTFGLNAKPNTTSPIGYFGTGLKMAIATLVRNKVPVTLFIGKKQYVFTGRPDQFRDQPFEQVWMDRRESFLSAFQKEALPFTIQLAKNWELWMAFRELESNTRDEQGETYPSVMEGWDPKQVVTDDTTHIVVEGEAFMDIYNHRDTVFLPEALREPDYTIPGKNIQVFRKASNYLYYKGMRVMKLEKPSIMTYNILSNQMLTEDRTLAHQSVITYELAEWAAGLTDKSIIHHFLNADEENWESTWPFDYISTPPSTEFKEAIKIRKAGQAKKLQDEASAGHAVWKSNRISSYIDRHEPRTRTSKQNMLWYHFQEWLDQFLCSDNIHTPAEDHLMKAVLADLKESETEYYPNKPVDEEMPF